MQSAQVVEIGSRNKILDAAEALFARRGYSGVGMREVAEAVGLGKSSLFHHFSGKVQLYAAVAGRILAIFDERLSAALAGSDVPSIKLARWIETLVDTLADHPTSARLLLRSLFEDDEHAGVTPEERYVDDTLRHLIEALSRLLADGMASGEFRRASIPHAVQSIIGLTVYHFASGEFGEELIGQSQFTPEEVRRRKREVLAFLNFGLGIQSPVTRTTRPRVAKK